MKKYLNKIIRGTGIERHRKIITLLKYQYGFELFMVDLYKCLVEKKNILNNAEDVITPNKGFYVGYIIT